MTTEVKNQERWYTGDCQTCKAMCVDCCNECERCVDHCICYELTAEESALVIGAIPLQALPRNHNAWTDEAIEKLADSLIQQTEER